MNDYECPHCGSKKYKYVRTEEYITPGDQNPVVYQCLNCGETFTKFE